MVRGLYGMADAGAGAPLVLATALAGHGVSHVQLRCKGWETARLAELGRAVAGLGVQVIVNDDVAAARACGGWVHLGQEDGEGPEDVPYGRSCHTLEQVEAVAALVAARSPLAPRYIGFGPVFGTATKDTGYSPRGTALLAEAVRRCPVSVVAIGGIHLGNIDAVRATGVPAWAVIGGIWSAPDPTAAILALR